MSGQDARSAAWSKRDPGLSREAITAASFDDRAEPAQATPAGGVAEEVPHDGRASATPPPSAATRTGEDETCGGYAGEPGTSIRVVAVDA